MLIEEYLVRIWNSLDDANDNKPPTKVVRHPAPATLEDVKKTIGAEVFDKGGAYDAWKRLNV